MIRTSGETRLSDFLLPQSSHATLCFSAALWPDFSFLDMLAALAQYQRDGPTLRQNAQAAQQCIADSRSAQPVSISASSDGLRHNAAAPTAAGGVDTAATEQRHAKSSDCPVSTGEQHAGLHALRRRHPAGAAACERQPETRQAVPSTHDDGVAAGEAASTAAVTCRAASRRKVGMQTSLQFDVLANSTAPALIS